MRVSEQLAGAILLFSTCIFNASQISAQNDEAIPDLSGIWDGGFSVRPVNGVDVPWGEDNFPNLNARALAYQEVWEETMAPKYDCQPASSPDSVRPLCHAGNPVARSCTVPLRER